MRYAKSIFYDGPTLKMGRRVDIAGGGNEGVQMIAGGAVKLKVEARTLC